MWRKAAIVGASIAFVNLGWAIFRHDGYANFIPFIASINNRQVMAYDFFLIIAVLLLRSVALRQGVSLSNVRNSLMLFFGRYDFIELILIGVSVIGTHFFLVPLVFSLLADPISVISQCPDSIRRVVVITLPVTWILVLNWILKIGGGHSFRSSAPSVSVPQSSGMPQPPTW